MQQDDTRCKICRIGTLKRCNIKEFSSSFKMFVTNFQKLYQVGDCVPIDERMAKFRGRSYVISYMSMKIDMYIHCVILSWTYCFYNDYVYSSIGLIR